MAANKRGNFGWQHGLSREKRYENELIEPIFYDGCAVTFLLVPNGTFFEKVSGRGRRRELVSKLKCMPKKEHREQRNKPGCTWKNSERINRHFYVDCPSHSHGPRLTFFLI